MLELNKGNPILLIVSIFLLVLWFIHRWILKKHNRWILTYYLRRLDRLDKRLKNIGNLLERYPNYLTLMLYKMVMCVLIKEQKFIGYRINEIINSDLRWRMRNEKGICSIKH